MELRNIQRLEVVVRRFDFGTFDDRETNGEEDVFDFLEDLADEMVRADGANYAGEGEIDFFPSGSSFLLSFLYGDVERLQTAFDMAF